MIPGLLGSLSGGDPAFTLVVRTTVEPETFTFPRKAGEAYDCYIDWGDGSSISHLQTIGGDPDAHSYATAGDHIVKITGICSAIYFNNGDDKAKLLEIRNWGDVQFTTMERAFYGCSNMTITAKDAKPINTGSVVEWTFAFLACSSMTSFPFMDTSAGTTFYATWDATPITSFPLVDLSSATNIHNAWSFCLALTSFPLIDTSNVTNWEGAWYNASNLVTFPLLNMAKGNDFTFCWGECSIGTTSYSNILVSLAANNPNNSVVLGAGTNKYNAAGAAAKAILEAAGRDWVITDGGLES